MPLFALGLNHQTAPVALRERLAFPASEMAAALGRLRKLPGIDEAALLSTCNRTEIYFLGVARQEVAFWLANEHGISLQQLQHALYVHEGVDAVRHVFRVACGLDSMVLGEAQILGQLKGSVRLADAAGALGATLHKLFQHSFAVAKHVRSHTELGAHTVSMAAAAVQLAGSIFERLSDVRVLFVGAGEMVELCAAHFAGVQPSQMTVANRTRLRAEALAARFKADVLPLERIGEVLAAHDVVISCTASPVPLIDRAMVERALKARRRRPMVMVDLAVPRDIEPEVASLSDIFLYTLDDLARIVSRGQESRLAAAEEAEAMVALEVDAFWRWLASRHAVPVIRQLRDHAENLRQHELLRARRMLARGDDPQLVLDAITQALSNKLLHGPSRYLNQAEGREVEHASSTVQQIFQLNADTAVHDS